MKKYDFVVFGATGFTGQLIVEYLSNHKETSQLKWAVAGRSKSKLNNLYNSIDTLVVDSFDIESIDSMCKISKLIITTVGPYSIFGENLIKSCIEYSIFTLADQTQCCLWKRIRLSQHRHTCILKDLATGKCSCFFCNIHVLNT